MEYQHGGDIYTNRVELDYSANINPLGLPKGVKEALHRGIDNCSSYPDSHCGKLREALAAFYHLSKDFIICGNGAADLIFQIVLAVKPKLAVLVAPSFLEYEQALKAIDCHIIYFDLKEEDGFRLYIKKLCEWLGDCGDSIPDMIFLCNPNNPTGLVIDAKEMVELFEFCKQNRIFCILDECFNAFLEQPQQYSMLNVIKTGEYEDVFLLNAFTKLYAMAGLRLGYGICKNLSVLERMEEIRQPWSVSSPAQAAGEAALWEQEYVERTRILITEERAHMKEMMRLMGFHVYDSMANYLLFRDCRSEASGEVKKLYRQCLEKKILIRSCANYRGLDDTYYRVCVKDRESNERFLEILELIMTEEER